MNRIVLLNAPMDIIVDKRRFPPLGIASMAALLRSKGYICDVIDGDLPEYRDVRNIIRRLTDYDLIGISVTIPSLPNAVVIAENVKKIRELPILLGGHCATFMHEKIMEKYSCFDLIIRGEGESAIAAMCDDYFMHGTFTKTFDFVTSKDINGQIKLANSIAVEEDVDSLPFPIRDEYEKYFDSNNNIMTISSSRGCPYGCSFCSATNFRNKWIGRSPENVADEVFGFYQKEKEFKIIFVDDNFYIDPERSVKILQEIEKKCHRSFEFVFATRADQIINNGRTYLNVLKRYGCIEIEMGIENGSDSVLKRYNKNITAEQNKLALKILRDLQINSAIDYVLFDPETTRAELLENIQFLKSAYLWGYDSPLIYERIIAFPGTQFTECHPDLYRDDCMVQSGLYFHDRQVLEIYRWLQEFRHSYQNKIDLLVWIIRSRYLIENNVPSCKNDLIWLKVLPYNLFDRLAQAQDEYKQVYETFILNNQISLRLQQYELLYLYPEAFIDYGL